MNPSLLTPRLCIREFVAEDAVRLFELDSDPQVLRYIGNYRRESPAEYLDVIETVNRPIYQAYRAQGTWAVETRDRGEFLGWVCLRPALGYRFHEEAGFQADDAELGYRLKRTAWAQGYATEAARAVLARGFEVEPIARAVAAALRDNAASVHVIDKCGLTPIGQFAVPGFECPAISFALPRAAWIAR